MIKAIVTGATVAGALLVGGQAFAQSTEVWDPIEPLNRGIWEFNSALRSAVYSPIASAYRDYVPPNVQVGVDNVMTNLREPVTALSSVVTGDFENAKLSAGRFVINLTAGIGGIYDVATAKGWVSRPIDLGTALCKLEVPAGPYVVLPFVGPSTLRDTAGLAATYSIALDVAGDWGWTYIGVDRALARASNPRILGQDYESDRTAYAELRGAFCDDSLPAATLKASPLGQTIEVAPAM